MPELGINIENLEKLKKTMKHVLKLGVFQRLNWEFQTYLETPARTFKYSKNLSFLFLGLDLFSEAPN